MMRLYELANCCQLWQISLNTPALSIFVEYQNKNKYIKAKSEEGNGGKNLLMEISVTLFISIAIDYP